MELVLFQAVCLCVIFVLPGQNKLILKLKEQFSAHNELISNTQQPISTVSKPQECRVLSASSFMSLKLLYRKTKHLFCCFS